VDTDSSDNRKDNEHEQRRSIEVQSELYELRHV
jgi:hypothetical protein